MKSTMNKQLGGTLLGFIIGLVVGLAIAVVVALMITKSSTPFTNKLGISKNPDAPTVQLTDPNKPLYGSAAKETLAAKPLPASAAAAPAVTTSADTAAGTSAVKSEQAKSEAKPDAKSAATAAKALDNLIAKSEADDKVAYFLQVGAFHDVSDAENTRAKLALIGIESHISQKSNEADSLFRVRVGPFDQMDAMNRMRTKLTENSIDVAVVKTPK